MALCFAVGLTVAQPADQAQASTNYVTLNEMRATSIAAHKSGGFSAFDCTQVNASFTPAVYIDGLDATRNTLPSASSGNIHCASGAEFAHDNGTLYGTYMPNNATSDLVAWKNGRQLWATDIRSSGDCQAGSGVSLQMRPLSMSEGPDGMLYMVLVAMVSPQTCNDRLVGINPTTGAVVSDVWLGAPDTYIQPAAWTYQDRIMVVDRSGMVREFDYEGDENTSAQYQFPLPTGHAIGQLAANDEGTVFAMSQPTWTIGDPPTLLYRKANGATGAIPNTSAGYGVYQLQPTHNGTVVSLTDYPARIDSFDLSSNTMASTTPIPQTTGYTNSSLQAYLEDENGNQLMMWSHWNNATTRATSVEVHDASNNTTDVVFLKERKPNNPTYPEFYEFSGGFIRDGVANNTLYLPICEDAAASCFDTTTAPDMQIYKITLGSFGEPLGKGFKRNAYESQKLEYVAMGDSFSSGEGVEPFLLGTAIDGTNECHRSEDAYPMLLEEDPDLNLNLTAFVACSGATTDTLLGGGTGIGSWNEESQLNALSESTDVVTLTIGGNDIGFADVLRACLQSVAFWTDPGWDCASDSSVTDPLDERMSALQGTSSSAVYVPGSVTPIHSITEVIQSIAIAAPNADIHVAGYPHLFGPELGYFEANASAPGYGQCDVAFWGGFVTLAYDDAQWINDQADRLNSIIKAAVGKARDDDVSVEYTPLDSFATHALCDEAGSYIEPLFLEGALSNPDVVAKSFHPNNNGASAYKAALLSMLQ